MGSRAKRNLKNIGRANSSGSCAEIIEPHIVTAFSDQIFARAQQLRHRPGTLVLPNMTHLPQGGITRRDNMVHVSDTVTGNATDGLTLERLQRIERNFRENESEICRETYGRSPAMDALPSVEELNVLRQAMEDQAVFGTSAIYVESTANGTIHFYNAAQEVLDTPRRSGTRVPQEPFWDSEINRARDDSQNERFLPWRRTGDMIINRSREDVNPIAEQLREEVGNAIAHPLDSRGFSPGDVITFNVTRNLSVMHNTVAIALLWKGNNITAEQAVTDAFAVLREPVAIEQIVDRLIAQIDDAMAEIFVSYRECAECGVMNHTVRSQTRSVFNPPLELRELTSRHGRLSPISPAIQNYSVNVCSVCRNS